MNIYIVYCDITSGKLTESTIADYLNEFDGIRFFPFGWLIKSSKLSGVIAEELAKITTYNDSIIVSLLSDDYACQLPENIRNWILRNFK